MKPQGYSLAEQVRARSLVFDRGDAVMVPLHTAPALALRAAELALGGPAAFAGFNQLGHAVYRREEEGGR
ncbi:hypothetical protein [Leucobacter komagatae]|uniref:Uncharacterized protein n=1 Tax=Leucobacter komagatae TaxID=55969 RepID=A0A0D0IQF2_9MICO|nr:hypothetical protein [Leucobacter komagatae]KIP53819.1 hypothetical protein SD72_01150 [Leucobacter komagatae]